MKNITLLIACICFCINLLAQEVKIDANGKVAIGKVTPPAYPLDIEDKDDIGKTINVTGKGTGISVLTNGNGTTLSTFGINAGAFGGTGSNTGVQGTVSDLQSGMLGYGLFGLNTNFSNLGTGYGVYGRSTGSLTNYGVFGEASGGTTNWAGYFKGNSHFTDRLSVGTLLSDYPIMVKMNQSLFNNSLIYAEVEGSESVDDIAIKGLSKPIDNYGIGGQFEGGKIGVEGISNSNGSMIYTGVFGKSSGGTGTNYGLRGVSTGGITNLGVYGEASGGVNNWSGYFKGNSHFTKSLNVGTTNDDYPIHLKVHQDSINSTINVHGAHFEITNVSDYFATAVVGFSKGENLHGVGGTFEGGHIGAIGKVDAISYEGTLNLHRHSGLEGISHGNENTYNTGIYGESWYGLDNKGVIGTTAGPNKNTGIYGEASNYYYGSNAVENIAIRGFAYGAETLYGGYLYSDGAVSTTNYGIYAIAEKATDKNYAVYGESTNGVGERYAIYGKAPGSWAAYFEGKGYFSDSVGIGTTSPGVKFTVDGGSDASLTGGGYIMTNSLGATNVVIDNNEIMARNNGAAAPLWINNEGGNVGINNRTSSSPKTNLHIRHDDPGFGMGSIQDAVGLRIDNFTFVKHWTLNAGGFGHLRLFDTDGTEVGDFNPVSGTYVSVSDRRVKSNVEKMPDILDKIKILSPKSYQFKNDKRKTAHLGFLAQDVEGIFPELVEYNKNTDKYLMNYSGFGVIAIKGIQELDAENLKLKSEIHVLKSKNEDLENRMNKLEKLIEQLSKS